ncbi:MAG: hypothetical protein QNJ35_02180 [Paracoccaceae bacterium]|nr:hypothetical protein [Paracoccaceae bacterium]
MSRFETIIPIAMLALYGALAYWKGALFLDEFEGDGYHMMDILLRLHAGKVIHLDFFTPLGFFAFYPTTAFMAQGFGVGNAILWGQFAVAAALLPFVIYAGVTRLERGPAALFMFACMSLLIALTPGEADGSVSMGMHYNRWCWAAGFTLLLIAMLPPMARQQPWLDGALLGILGAFLLLTKATYFVFLVPAACVALLIRRDVAALAAAMMAGVAAILAFAIVFGPAFWLEYVGSLIEVSRSETRPNAGVPYTELLAGSGGIGATVLACLSAMLIRRTGHDGLGLLWLILVPGLAYIAFQNFGTDPVWLMFLAVLLLALRPEAGQVLFLAADLRTSMNVVAAMCVGLFLPVWANFLMSTLDHAAFDRENYVEMLPAWPDHQDVFVSKRRAETLNATLPLGDVSEDWAHHATLEQEAAQIEFQGIEYGECLLAAGLRAQQLEMSDRLQSLGVAEGSTVFTADILSVAWLFGPFAPVENGAPWYYGGQEAFEAADYVVIPKCAVSPLYRKVALEELAAAVLDVRLVDDNDVLTLFEVR